MHKLIKYIFYEKREQTLYSSCIVVWVICIITGITEFSKMNALPDSHLINGIVLCFWPLAIMLAGASVMMTQKIYTDMLQCYHGYKEYENGEYKEVKNDGMVEIAIESE